FAQRGDRRLQHGLVGYEHRFYVGRRDPFRARLEHVVRAPDVVVLAVLRLAELVAAEEPLAAHLRAGLLPPVEVHGRGARPAHDQIAGLPSRDLAAALVDDLHLVSIHRYAGGVRFGVAAAGRAIDVERLGGADLVDDLHPDP